MLALRLAVPMIVLSGWCSSAVAETRPAASCALADVQAAVNAARAGDTVQLPAGSATWTGSLSIEKGIHLKGAGAGGFRGSSRTSLEIGTGAKTFVTQAALDLRADQIVRALYIADGSRYMEGTVTAHRGTSLEVNVTRTGGSGTYGSWVLAVPAATVVVNDAANDWNRAMVDIFEDPAASAEVSGIRFKSGTATYGEHLNLHGRAGGKPLRLPPHPGLQSLPRRAAGEEDRTLTITGSRDRHRLTIRHAFPS